MVAVPIVAGGEVGWVVLPVLPTGLDRVDFLGYEMGVSGAEVEGILIFGVRVEVVALRPVDAVAVVELELLGFR